VVTHLSFKHGHEGKFWGGIKKRGFAWYPSGEPSKGVSMKEAKKTFPGEKGKRGFEASERRRCHWKKWGTSWGKIYARRGVFQVG